MVFPSTHDRATDSPKAPSPKGLFESSPAGAALDDTRPFSLFNALLADVPEAVHYDAPAFQPLPRPVVIDEPTAGQMAAKLLRNEDLSAWPNFYTEIRSCDAPSSASESVQGTHLWYQITSQENAGYETTARVPLESPLAKLFTS